MAIDGEAVGRVATEALAAGCLGILGALARKAVEVEPRPMLRPAVIIRILGDASLGIGCWLLLSAMGHTGMWAFAAAWVAGALGFAALHDVLLRVLNKRMGG